MINDLPTAIMYLLVGISVLLVGMKLMSRGLKKIAGKGLKAFFRKTQNNPVVGMGMGVAITAVIQSSDATAALVIGFINAGVMTLFQGLSIILGAYIGTTVTGVLASFSSVSFSVYLLGLAFLGTVMSFFSKPIIKNIGEILTGFGLLFFGLAVMKAAFQYEDINGFCVSLFSAVNNPIVLYLIGVILAALAQSSSAVTGIVIAMVGGGALGLNSALFIALGATLGTVTNTLLSSMHGSVEGKRAAFIAFVIRALTSLTAVLIVALLQTPIVTFLHTMAINGKDEFPLAMFTVIYNVIFMPLMIPLLKPLIKLATKIVKEKESKNVINCIQFIDDRLLKTPEISLMQVRKEIMHMYDLAYESYTLAIAKMINYSNENTQRIAVLEEQVDYLNERITDFLIKLANYVSSDDERKVGAFFHVINDIERIGDHAYNFSVHADEMNGEELFFSPAAKEEIQQMHEVLKGMFDAAKKAFIEKDKKYLPFLSEQETHTTALKEDFYTNHYDRVVKEQCSPKMTPYMSSLIVELERIADHLTNIGFSIDNPTGENK